jgi:hypothetical protein
MKNIVLVVGAGASYELDVPTGKELIGKIIQNIDFNPEYNFGNGKGQFLDLVNQFLNFIGKPSDTDAANRRNRVFFEKSLIPFKSELQKWAESNRGLDAFLNQRTDNDIKQFGKFAIAYYILGQEEWLMRQGLFVFKENWLRYFLLRHLAPIKETLRVGEVNIRIITFNYDRIIEHFLYNFLRHFGQPIIPGFDQSIDNDESKSIVDLFGIIHVYDKLAKLEWEDREGQIIRFGERNNNEVNLSMGSQAIRLIAETGIGRVSEETKREIRKVMEDASKIYFLGFGFDEDNMKILFGDNVMERGFQTTASCIATAVNLAPTIRDLYPFISFNELKCYEVMKDGGPFAIEL